MAVCTLSSRPISSQEKDSDDQQNNEEIEFIIEATKRQMEGTINSLNKKLGSIRAGKASPTMLSDIRWINMGLPLH